MAFSGNLEHLPIVDVLQLLETTKKSGTLLVRKDNTLYLFGIEKGYIVSITHPNTSQSLGKAITFAKILDDREFFELYNYCRNNKTTIVNFLLNKKGVSIDKIAQILNHFAELTVVDILTWSSGNFELTIDNIEISDEFKSLPQPIYISIQNTLMEALRIFDEWTRDNLLKDGIFQHEDILSKGEQDSLVITEDILGLDNVEKLERKIPNVFNAIKEINQTDIHRKKIKEYYPSFSSDVVDELTFFLSNMEEKKEKQKTNNTLILLTSNDFDKHVLSVMSRHLGMFIFTTDSKENILPIVSQSLLKDLEPILIIDSLEYDYQKLPFKIPVVILTERGNYLTFMKYFEEGCSTIMLKPDRTNASEVLAFYRAIYSFLNLLNSKINYPADLKSILKRLRNSTRISDIANTFYAIVENYFKRTALFQVQKESLHIETTKGLYGKEILSFEPTLSPIVTDCINTGNPYFKSYTVDIGEALKVTKPESDSIILIPLHGLRRTFYLIYADTPLWDVPIQTLKLLQALSNALIDALCYRKLFEKNKRSE